MCAHATGWAIDSSVLNTGSARRRQWPSTWAATCQPAQWKRPNSHTRLRNRHVAAAVGLPAAVVWMSLKVPVANSVSHHGGMVAWRDEFEGDQQG